MRKPTYTHRITFIFLTVKMLLEIADDEKMLNKKQAWYFQLRFRNSE